MCFFTQQIIDSLLCIKNSFLEAKHDLFLIYIVDLHRKTHDQSLTEVLVEEAPGKGRAGIE